MHMIIASKGANYWWQKPLNRWCLISLWSCLICLKAEREIFHLQIELTTVGTEPGQSQKPGIQSGCAMWGWQESKSRSRLLLPPGHALAGMLEARPEPALQNSNPGAPLGDASGIPSGILTNGPDLYPSSESWKQELEEGIKAPG